MATNTQATRDWFLAYAQGYADAMADAGESIYDSGTFAEQYADIMISADKRVHIEDAFAEYRDTEQITGTY